MNDESFADLKERVIKLESVVFDIYKTLARIEEAFKSFRPAGCGDVCKLQSDKINVIEIRLSAMEKRVWMFIGAIGVIQVLGLMTVQHFLGK